MLPSLLSVDEYLSLLIDALEVELDKVGFGGGELLSVFTLATWIPATSRSRRSCLWVRPRIDVPVVGQVN